MNATLDLDAPREREQLTRRLPVLSASKLTLADECLYPWTSGLPWDNSSGEAGRFGDAVHAFAECYIEGEPRSVEELALEHELTDSQLSRLRDQAIDIECLLDGEQFERRRAEVRIAYDPMRGTARELAEGEERAGGEMLLKIDVLIEGGGLVTIRDWKTGKRPVLRRVAETLQVRAYALAVALAYDLDEVRVELAWCSPRGIWIDHARFDAFDFSVTEVDIRELMTEQLEGDAVPSYGLHCHEHFCPVIGRCPAAAAAAQRVADACGATHELAGHPTEVSDHEHALEMLRLIPLVRARADAADEALKEWVRRNGALELGDGRSWGPVEQNGNDRLDATERALEVIREQLGAHADAAADTKVTVTKASLERGLKALVREAGEQKKRGALKKRRDALHAELRACGALRPGAPYTRFDVFARATESTEVE